MKVLHLNSSDIGGAGIAAIRLNQALINAGIDSSLLVSRKHGDHPFVKELPPVSKALARTRSSLAYRALAYTGFLKEGLRSVNVLPTRLHTLLNATDADVVHLHWINNEMISLADLGKIKKPVVWTLHDMWPFCGAEHYTDDNRYVTGYQSSEFRVQGSEGRGQTTEDGGQIAKEESPNVSSLRPKAFFDLDRWVFGRKQKHWKNWKPHPVCVSHWEADCVRQSVLFKKLTTEVIPNCLDLNIFKPMDRVAARKKFNLPMGKKLILFGAFNPSDQRKGGDLLAAALDRVKTEDVELVVFGATHGEQVFKLSTRWMGSVKGETEMAALYNACDLVCVPSRMESFGQTASEPLACGVPVVAFKTTGLIDIIDHQQNGWLAAPFDPVDLCRGMEWVFQHKESEALRLLARKKAEACFNGRQAAMRYSEVYRSSCAFKNVSVRK
jgi:glycosyltransferase involved in cell wall biosynthesis